MSLVSHNLGECVRILEGCPLITDAHIALFCFGDAERPLQVTLKEVLRIVLRIGQLLPVLRINIGRRPDEGVAVALVQSHRCAMR